MNLNLLYHTLVHLKGVDFEVKVFEFDQRVDALGKDGLEVTLPRSSSCICSHHSRDGGVGAKKRRVLGGVVELVGKDGLAGSSSQRNLDKEGFSGLHT